MTDQLIMEEDGKRYRMLQVGETLEAGDEVNADGWYQLYRQCLGFKVTDPLKNNEWPQGYYRRPIE